MTELLNAKSRSLLDPTAVDQTIVVIGVGAVGSNIATALVRMGLTKLCFYDFDKVEAKNVNNQAYYNDQVGKPKVEASYDNCVRINGVLKREQFKEKRFEKETCNKELVPNTIVIMAVDQGRQKIWEWLKDDPRVTHMLECGISHDVFRIQVADAKNKKKMSIATPEEEIPTELSPCGESLSIGGPIEMIAGLTATIVRGILRKESEYYMNQNNRYHIYPYFDNLTNDFKE